MTAVKSFAFGALVIGAAAHSSLAGPLRTNGIRWQEWGNRDAAVAPASAPAPQPVAPPAFIPYVAPAVPAYTAPPAPMGADNWQASSLWTGSGANAVVPTMSPATPQPVPIAIAAPALTALVFNPSSFDSSTVTNAPAAAPVSTPTAFGSLGVPAATSTGGGATYDAFINLSSGKYAEAAGLASGTPQAWYLSPVAAAVYGGTPNAQQQADFSAKVLADVQHTFDLANVPVHLTTDPNAVAAHTLSVVSGASYAANGNTIGITDVGQNGFDFIDKLGSFQTPDQLALAVAHNVAHELMHAFGIAVHHDTTGNYIDSGSASASLLTDPNATFSPAAAADLLSRNFQSTDAALGNLGGQSAVHPANCNCPLCRARQLGAQTVPEPTTLVLWLSVGGVALARVYRLRASA